MPQHIIEHCLSKGKTETFAGRYNYHQLIYYVFFKYTNKAIAREKGLKKWSRQKKQDLITVFNPKWNNLHYALFDKWPPRALFHRKMCNPIFPFNHRKKPPKCRIATK